MAEIKALKLAFDVPGENFDQAGEASAKLKRTLQQVGVPAEVIRRVAIGSYEGEINLIIHAGGGQLQAEIYPDHTRVIVSDQGPGVQDVKEAMEEGYSTASEAARAMGFGAGMGLPNMYNCADAFEIQSRVGWGTLITMDFKHNGR